MATLDEKYLDGPNVGYCSDSDEEEVQQPDTSSQTNRGPPPSATSGRAGAKGVLDDYRASIVASKIAKLKAERSVRFYIVFNF